MDKDDGYDLRAVLPNSLLEWEDRIAAVAVSGGCPWRCVYCHGGEFVTAAGLAGRPRLPLADLWETLDRQQGWLDGVVFSGGEPTIQPGLPAALAGVKARGLAVKLHTNGSRPEVLRRLLADGLIDTLALDHKAPPDERLERVVGVDLPEAARAAVRESFSLALAWSAPAAGRVVEYHSTFCPAVLGPDDLPEMAALMAPDGEWFIQSYRPGAVLDPAAAGDRAYDRDEMAAIAETARFLHPGRVFLKD